MSKLKPYLFYYNTKFLNVEILQKPILVFFLFEILNIR